eukprot:542259_1
MNCFALFLLLCSYFIECFGGNYSQLAMETVNEILLHLKRPIMYDRTSSNFYQPEINATKELESIIYGIKHKNDMSDIKFQQITNLIKQIQLFKPFILKRKKLIGHLLQLFKEEFMLSKENTINAINSKNAMYYSESTLWINMNQQFRDIIRQMGTHLMTFDEYSALSFAQSLNLSNNSQSKLKLLILCHGVAMSPLWSTTIKMKWPDLKRMTYGGIEIYTSKSFPWFCWKREATGLNTLMVMVHRFYFTNLYLFIWEHYYQQMNLPKLESVFNIKNDMHKIEQFKLLTTLINQYGLVIDDSEGLHNRLQDIKQSFFMQFQTGAIFNSESAFIWVIIRMHRLTKLLCDTTYLKKSIYKTFWRIFITDCILKMADSLHINCNGSISQYGLLYGVGTTNGPEYFARKAVVNLIAVNYRMKTRSASIRFIKLTKLLASSVFYCREWEEITFAYYSNAGLFVSTEMKAVMKDIVEQSRT